MSEQEELKWERQAELEIGVLRIVGVLLMMAAVLIVICGAVMGTRILWLGGLGVGFVGFATRAVGGLWGTLERIARK